MDGENETRAESNSSLPSYIHTPPNRQSDGLRPAEPTQLPQAQTQHCVASAIPVGDGVVRGRTESVPDIRMPRSRPLGPRKPSGSQGQNKVFSLKSYRLRTGSVSSAHSNLQQSGVGLGTPQTSRKLSTASIRGRPAPRFPTVPVRWRGYTLNVARWTFTSQELQEIASRAIKASTESYHVRLLKQETLDTELPEELHRLELLTTDLKTRIRVTVSARRELLDALTAHASGAATLDHHDLERIVEELGVITQLADELNDELYTVADQIAQLKRLRDVHSSSALAMSLRKLNTSFLRQATENQLLRERVVALEAEKDIAWTQAEDVAQELDDLSAKLEQGVTSTPSSANDSRRASRINAVRKSNIRVSKSGLRHSLVGKTTSRTPNRSSSVASFIQCLEIVPPVPPIPDIQDFGSGVSQQPRRRPPFIQTVNLPEQVTPGTLASFESGSCGIKNLYDSWVVLYDAEYRNPCNGSGTTRTLRDVGNQPWGPDCPQISPKVNVSGFPSKWNRSLRIGTTQPGRETSNPKEVQPILSGPYLVSVRCESMFHLSSRAHTHARYSGNLPWLISHCRIESRAT